MELCCTDLWVLLLYSCTCKYTWTPATAHIPRYISTYCCHRAAGPSFDYVVCPDTERVVWHCFDSAGTSSYRPPLTPSAGRSCDELWGWQVYGYQGERADAGEGGREEGTHKQIWQVKYSYMYIHVCGRCLKHWPYQNIYYMFMYCFESLLVWILYVWASLGFLSKLHIHVHVYSWVSKRVLLHACTLQFCKYSSSCFHSMVYTCTWILALNTPQKWLGIDVCVIVFPLSG